MSSISGISRDLTVLPTTMLPLAKSHLRVDGSYDDAYITMSLGRAISWFERVTNVSVNPIDWLWLPDAADFCGGAARVPASPVNAGFTVQDGAATDITADYRLTSMSQHGVGLYQLTGAHVGGMEVMLPSGYASLDVLDPGIADIVLRYTAHLYENREILVPGSDAATPGWMLDVVATYWMPRA